MFKFANASISWCNKKQLTVALSPTEAEYTSIVEALKEAVLFYNLHHEVFKVKRSINISTLNDNQSARKLASNTAVHNRAKHIDIRLHFICEATNNDVIMHEYLSTDLTTADVLTKILNKISMTFAVKTYSNQEKFCRPLQGALSFDSSSL